MQSSLLEEDSAQTNSEKNVQKNKQKSTQKRHPGSCTWRHPWGLVLPKWNCGYSVWMDGSQLQKVHLDKAQQNKQNTGRNFFGYVLEAHGQGC